jgi:hypothetical protein
MTDPVLAAGGKGRLDLRQVLRGTVLIRVKARRRAATQSHAN